MCDTNSTTYVLGTQGKSQPVELEIITLGTWSLDQGLYRFHSYSALNLIMFKKKFFSSGGLKIESPIRPILDVKWHTLNALFVEIFILTSSLAFDLYTIKRKNQMSYKILLNGW